MFVLLLAVSVHQAGHRATHSPAFSDSKYDTATGAGEAGSYSSHRPLWGVNHCHQGDVLIPFLQSWEPSLGQSPSHCSPGWNRVTIKPCKQLIHCALPQPSKSHPERCVLSSCKLAHGLPAAETDIILLVIDMRGAVPVHTSWESGLWTTCIEFIGSSVHAHKLCLQCREGFSAGFTAIFL